MNIFKAHVLERRVRAPDIRNAVRGIISSAARGIVGGTVACLLIPAAGATNADAALTTVLDTLTTYVTIAGGVLCVWGAVVLGSGLNDHNGPGIQQGIWRIVGGGVIIAASALFSGLT